jgi:hypothetical protein
LQDDGIAARPLLVEDKTDAFVKIEEELASTTAPRAKLFGANSDEGNAPDLEPITIDKTPDAAKPAPND